MIRGRPPAIVAYQTRLGRMLKGHAETLLLGGGLKQLEGKIQLIFTSPPFALNHKKQYGNYTGAQYVAWLSQFAPLFAKMLSPTGSIVIELGNAWIPGHPAMSTLALEALLAFKNLGGYYLCQEFICHNPAKLPTPAEWVTVQRIRLKDSYTRLWWLAKTDRPKANNRNVLQGYSDAMQKLLKTGTYNAGRRPSEHNIRAESFLKDHGGAIPPNFLTIANTKSNGDRYQTFCKDHDLTPHPARMPQQLAEFFIRFLTSADDWVLDPFAGSNTTGAVAEALARRWVSIEPQPEYIKSSKSRFKTLSVYRGKRLRVRRKERTPSRSRR